MEHEEGKKSYEEESKLEVRKWLNEEVHLGEYGDLFINEGFDDMLTVLEMDNNDLIEIGIEKRGHRKKIMIFIQKRKATQNSKQNVDIGAPDNCNEQIDMMDDVEGTHVIDTAIALVDNDDHNNPIVGVNIEDTAK